MKKMIILSLLFLSMLLISCNEWKQKEEGNITMNDTYDCITQEEAKEIIEIGRAHV